MTLRGDVDQFINGTGGSEELYKLIDRCVAEGGATGLSCLRDLAESEYGGITFKAELRAPAAASLLLFGEAGLRELAGIGLKRPDSSGGGMAMELLAGMAGGEPAGLVTAIRSESLTGRLNSYLSTHEELRAVAQRHVIDIVLAFADDDDLTMRVGTAFMRLGLASSPAKKSLFAAISARWIAIGSPVLTDYRALIAEHPNEEPIFQAFFTSHPHLLDPLAVQVWPQPDLFGFRAPDFIVRRADNSYVVVEIECPGKSLVTRGLQATAELTHAISQVTDYDRYLMTKFADVVQHFPGWDIPELLVVCGLEADLDDEQKAALRNFNRGSRAKAVGFDWLAKRAEAVAGNVVRGEIVVSTIRLV